MNTPTLDNTALPDWVRAVFDELDLEQYGAGLDVLIEDAEVQLGGQLWRGREVVQENLRASNVAGESHHRVLEFWNGGSVRILRGEITVTSSDTGQVATSAMGHFLHMHDHEPTKVRRWIGAFGPLNC